MSQYRLSKHTEKFCCKVNISLEVYCNFIVICGPCLNSFYFIPRSNAHQQTQLDKSKKAADEARNKSDRLETHISSLKKVRFADSL